jgi:hypothetical protein
MDMMRGLIGYPLFDSWELLPLLLADAIKPPAIIRAASTTASPLETPPS